MKHSWLELSTGRFFNVYCTLALTFLCLSIKSRQNLNYNFNNNHILKIEKLHFFFSTFEIRTHLLNSLKTCTLSATTLLLIRIGVSSRGPVVRWVGSCLSRSVDLFLAWFVGCRFRKQISFYNCWERRKSQMTDPPSFKPFFARLVWWLSELFKSQ